MPEKLHQHLSGGEGNPSSLTKPPKALGFAHQLQHPWAATTSGKAAEEAEDDDGGARPDEHVGGIGGVLSNEGDVGAEGELAPDADCEKDNAGDLQSKGRDVSGATGEGIQSQHTGILKGFAGAALLAEGSLRTSTNSRGMDRQN